MSFCDQPTITDAWPGAPGGHPEAEHFVLQPAHPHGRGPCPPAGHSRAQHEQLRAVHGRSFCAPQGHPHAAHAALRPAHHHGCSAGAPQGHIKCLVLHRCSMPFTEVGLAHLRGITRLHMQDANAASIAAARDLGLPATTGECTESSAFRYSDTQSGPCLRAPTTSLCYRLFIFMLALVRWGLQGQGRRAAGAPWASRRPSSWHLSFPTPWARCKPEHACPYFCTHTHTHTYI